MDSFTFQAMALELNKRLANSRLDKVVQPGPGAIVLKLWTGQEKVQLMLNAEGQGSFYLSTKNYPAPAKQPRFCQLLRARLRRLVEVKAEPYDRIAHFRFLGPEGTQFDLVLETLGQHGNLILLDETGKIVDLLYRRDGQRKLLPGETYTLPQHKERIDLFGDITEASAALTSAEGQGDKDFKELYPMSPALAFAISSARKAGQSFPAILTRIRDVFATEDFSPCKIVWGGKQGVLPIFLQEGAGVVEKYSDLSLAFESFLEGEEENSTKNLVASMASVIAKQHKRLLKRKEHIAQDSARQSNPEQHKHCGDLILANLHRISRGDAFVEVEDYFQSPSVMRKIELDTTLTPQENAEKYFKLYRKARKSGEHHARRLQETDAEIEWLEQVELSLQEAVTGDDIYQVQVELEAAGLLKKEKGQLGKRKEPRPEDQLYSDVTPGGWQLHWGKNSRTNDYVSRSMTSAGDYWFHARGMPGSHLVLKCGDSREKVDETDVLYAASYAAGYSKGKDAGKVEVIVADGKDVKKPKGAKPGLVTVDSYRSVNVPPKRLDE